MHMANRDKLLYNGLGGHKNQVGKGLKLSTVHSLHSPKDDIGGIGLTSLYKFVALDVANLLFQRKRKQEKKITAKSKWQD